MSDPSSYKLQLAGLPTLLAPMSTLGFAVMAFLAILAVGLSFSSSNYIKKMDRGFFWAVGLGLVGFALLRPIGLARDDLAYVEIVKSLCVQGNCAEGAPIVRDYVWYGFIKLGALYWPENFRVALAVSGIGVLIKLCVIDHLCSHRLIALLLFIPLCYVQYDLTQLRAGFAISWMMIGVYALVRSRVWVGLGVLGTNFMVHSQAIFSPGLLCYRIFGLSRWILPVLTAFALFLIYTGFYPSVDTLSWLGGLSQTAPYYMGSQSGAYVGVRLFPWAYFLILGYGLWLCDAERMTQRKLTEIVSAGIFIGMFVAWVFAINPTIQTRIFEFYAVLLVLLAGNVGDSRGKMAVTCTLALVLYMRLELLHDWILG